MPFAEYTANDLVYRLKLYDFSSSAQIQLDPADILRIADDVIKSEIAPALMKFNENYYLSSQTVNFVVGQAEYPLPQFAIMNMISNVDFVDANGYSYSISPASISNGEFRNNRTNGQAVDYYLSHKTITFSPPPYSAAQSYRIFYYRRPPFLTANENVAIITNVGYITGIVTYSSVPATGFSATSIHDFYDSNSPFVRLGEFVQASALAGVTQTFPVAAVQTLSVGDAVSVTGYSHVPDLPVELHLLLIHLLKSKLAQSQSDQTKFAMTKDQINEKMAEMLFIPGKRVINQVESLNLFNSPMF